MGKLQIFILSVAVSELITGAALDTACSESYRTHGAGGAEHGVSTALSAGHILLEVSNQPNKQTGFDS